MQRSISRKNNLTIFLYIVFFIIYESLSSIYLFLPPLFAVLFVLFIRTLKQRDNLGLLLVSLCLIFYEVNQGYILFSSIMYFSFVYKFILPPIKTNFSCNPCINFLYVLIAYLGFYFFLLLISNVFLLPNPDISYYVIYYIIIEFLLVSLI